LYTYGEMRYMFLYVIEDRRVCPMLSMINGIVKFCVNIDV